VTLRVLLVAHGHPELNPGGAEWASYLLFRELHRTDGVTAHFLAYGGDPATEDAVHSRSGATSFSNFRCRPDETVFSTTKFDRFLFSQPLRDAHEKFSELLEQINPDVIHFHHYLNVGLEFITIARRIKPEVRILVTLHEYLAICHHYGLMVKTQNSVLCETADAHECAKCFPTIRADDFSRRWLHIKSYFDQVDLFIAPSEFLRRRYIAWGIPAWQIVVRENGIEPVRPPPPRACTAGDGRVVFGYFGQIHPFKGLLELLLAFDHLSSFPHEATKGIRLIIHGAYLELNPPGYIATFKSLLAKTAARVHFAGPYDHKVQNRLMAEIDWVIVPSIWWENSPLVIQEAFAHRRPVICSDIGGMAENVRSGKDGFHFPVGDTFELAALLVRLAGDETIWDRLQSTIRQPMTISESASAHLELYRDRSFSFQPAR
jgi:glycosyltransferase involved in cell wall biosynthesis